MGKADMKYFYSRQQEIALERQGHRACTAARPDGTQFQYTSCFDPVDHPDGTPPNFDDVRLVHTGEAKLLRDAIPPNSGFIAQRQESFRSAPSPLRDEEEETLPRFGR